MLPFFAALPFLRGHIQGRSFSGKSPKRYLKAQIKPEELFNSPKFSFAKMQVEYTDVMFLYCLNHHEKAVQMIADKWLKESLWEISQKRIYLECVREEMEELQKKAA